MSFGKISVFGLGYIGLPTAAMFASNNVKVVGVDVNEKVIDTINKGDIHIVEPDLDVIVTKCVEEGALKASTVPEPSDAFLIAVPTPFKKTSSAIPEPDISYIKSAIESIAPHLRKGNLVVIESTSPVGTTETAEKWLMELRTDLSFPSHVGNDADVKMAYCPERVLPGKVITELVENDRIVGGLSETCGEYAKNLYKMFVEGECFTTNARTAEMAKLTENSCRDVNIAFANELSMICDDLDINVWELIALANRHPRINILQPGPGVGGHCIAVDPWFIVAKTPEKAKLIRDAREINDSKPDWVIEKVKAAINDSMQMQPEKSVKDITVSCFGLAFKPDIDDLRESPALTITSKIANLHQGNVIAVEPNISVLPRNLPEKLLLVDLDEALQMSDVLVLLVDHQSFKNSKPSLLLHQTLVDCRGVWAE